MIEKRGNVLEHLDTCDLLIVPSSSSITNGMLDMDRGIVKDINSVWSGLDRFFGEKIASLCGDAGYFWYMRHSTLPVALLQIKTEAQKQADPSIAWQGLWSVKELAECSPDMNIYIVIPTSAITKSVREYLDSIPDNVTRWQ
jgi:hypothetical protein